MKETQNPNPPAPKKPYSSPVLVEYGAVVKLTEGGGSKRNDSGPHTKA